MKYPSVRSLLARTRVQPPFAEPPSRAALLACIEAQAMGRLAQEEALRLLQLDEDARAWIARRDALRTALNSHYKPVSRSQVAGFSVTRAKRCGCPSCGRWRAELEAMTEDKKAKTGQA